MLTASGDFQFLKPFLGEAATRIAQSSGSSISESIRTLRRSHETVRRFCDDYEAAISSSRARLLVNANGLQAEPLTAETHHGGECVYSITGDITTVAYSVLRAHPRVFAAAVHFACDSLGFNGTVRSPAQQNTDANVAMRRYHVRSPIIDRTKASYASGIVLLCAQVTALTDAHADNVIFQDDFPVVIDDECIIQPIRRSQFRKLRADHHEAINGFSRSLLLPGPNNTVEACGLSELLDAGVDASAFESGYRDTIGIIAERQTEFVDYIANAISLHPWARYLIRSTELYSLCKRVAGTTIVAGLRPTEVRKAVLGCFAYETDAYPELNEFTEDEASILLRGDTPYYLMHLISGRVFANRDARHLLSLGAPFDWFRGRLSDCLSYATTKGISDIHAAIGCLTIA